MLTLNCCFLRWKDSLVVGETSLTSDRFCGLITFRVSRRRRKCIVVTRVCVSVRVSVRGWRDPDVTWGSGRGCPLVVRYWADLQSGHELRCYGNITQTRNFSEHMLVFTVLKGHKTDRTFVVSSFSQMATTDVTPAILSCNLVAQLYHATKLQCTTAHVAHCDKWHKGAK